MTNRAVQPPYECIRCAYKTPDRYDMNKHLYKRKKACPASHNDIDLSDEIKQYILTNRIYRIPKAAPPENPMKVINQTINYNNTMMNFVGGMDNIQKLSDYLNYKKLDLIPFDRSVELAYEKTRQKLERGQGHHVINQDDILEIIDRVTKIKNDNLEEFNVLYDSEMNKLMLYDSGDWKEMFLTSGMKNVVRTIQDYLWNAYECYLIRKIRRPDIHFDVRKDLREHIKEYYNFLACLDVDPYVKDHNDNQILYNPEDDQYYEEVEYGDEEHHSIADDYLALYKKTKDNLLVKQREKTRNELLDLIKRNSKKNVSELNKIIVSLINVDTEFKETLMAKKLALLG